MLPEQNGNKPERVALYARVSTEDQAERQTVQGQLDFLRSFCGLYGLPIAGEFIDDGWSGTIPLGQRLEGRRLLGAAEVGAFSVVLLYRLDRLGRSLSALLEAHGALERYGVTIRSATEPFDTATPIGKFIFGLLGGIAELEKSTIAERMGLGRDRVAKAGKWTGGPVPFGYDLDEDRKLVPSGRCHDGLAMSEAEILTDLFERIAAGSTLNIEARRLNAAGVPCIKRYAGGAEVPGAGEWTHGHIYNVLKNPMYTGVHTLNSRRGPIERPVPPLVSPALWQQAGERLTRNSLLSMRNAKRFYLLRGLIRCGGCGSIFVGHAMTRPARAGTETTFYQCGRQLGSREADPTSRCRAKLVRTDWLDGLVWQHCREFIFNPGDSLADAQRQLRSRLEQTAGMDEQRKALLRQIAEKEGERERAMTLFRRGRASLEETERQLDDIDQEASSLKSMLDAIRSQAELAAAFETHLSEAAAMLARLRGRVEEIEADAASDDPERRVVGLRAKQEIIELLVSGITVETSGEGRRKTAEVTIRYAFGEPTAVASSRNGPG